MDEQSKQFLNGAPLVTPVEQVDALTDEQIGKYAFWDGDYWCFTKEDLPDYARAIIAAARPAVPVQSAPEGCRMTGGICACHSGGSYGGCVRERESCCPAAPAPRSGS